MKSKVNHVIIETDRLILRAWKQSDTQPFIAMSQDKEVMRYYPSLLSEEEVKSFIRRITTSLQEKGYTLYAVEEKCTGMFIGYVGLWDVPDAMDFAPAVEIGWRLMPSKWGKGYATEAAKAVLKHAFTQLGFKKIVSFTACINEPSMRVMQKIGMSYVKKFFHPKIEKSSLLCEHVLYEIVNHE